MSPVDPSRMIDPGSGRDVADFLAARQPRFPVIVHSTNVPAVIGMLTVLTEAGWTTNRVIPEQGENWIARDWLPSLRNAIVNSIETTELDPILGTTSNRELIAQTI